MGNLAFVVFLALEVFLFSNVPFQQQEARVFNALATFGDSDRFLGFKIIICRLTRAAILGLDRHLDQQRETVFSNGEQVNQPPEFRFNHILEHGAPLAATLHTFRMAIAQLAVLVHAA
ncbi:MAG TPA: hypothetical protein PKD09_11020 [Aggregatilinea sp.]|uniref:hypothetical protein n=1 Tax=Aggregatilinea sp. TaxID=2806333 RepID=UPI002C628E99|nr:hypothetical protein [Aggregatilinea sp.]HML22173.1 hypothetical protein [Aggregatilinea sp.]